MQVSSGRSIKYGYKRTAGGAIDHPAETGRPRTPATGREVNFMWEIDHPSMNAGADANWANVASYVSDPDVEMFGTGNLFLTLLSWDNAFDKVPSFTKNGLIILDARIVVGADVTTGAGAFDQTAITTSLYVDTDNTNLNQLKLFEATSWPAAPSAPSHAFLAWATNNAPYVLDTNHRRLLLKMHNASGGTQNAGWMRIYVRAAEL